MALEWKDSETLWETELGRGDSFHMESKTKGLVKDDRIGQQRW